MQRVFTQRRFYLLILGCYALCSSAYAGDDSGLQTSVAVDLVAETAVGESSEASDKLDPRESELMLYGPIDHLFDGLLSLAAHPEDGQILFELHEAVISSGRLIPRSRFRLGQFFLGVGRLNQIHRHDWPFVSAPYVHEHFFDSEGALDTGLEYSLLLPLPFYLDVTAGVTNGFTYGHSHSAGSKPRKPTHYVRLATFLGSNLLGLNYLGRKAEDGVETRIMGFDYVFKIRNAKTLSWLVQAEGWQRHVQFASNADDETARGAYVYGQYGWNAHWQTGVRLDYFTVVSAEDAVGRSLENSKQAIVPTVTWAPSEFSKFRIAYEFFEDTFEGTEDRDDGKINQKVQVQSTFILGAHPAHDF